MRRQFIAGMLCFCSALAGAGESRTLTVFAAASLTDVMQQIGDAYTAATGVPVRFSFAGSAVLARQIESGAPAGVFIPADQEWMDYLARRRLIDTRTRTDVATNALVLVAPAASPLRLAIGPRFDLAAALGRSGRLATADVETVPAGRYAKAALQALQVWDRVERRLIAADNVRTALNFVALGEAPLGIVYATDARGSDKVRVVDRFPADSHPTIAYPAAVIRGADREAAAFVSFLRSDAAATLFGRHGFGTPSRQH